MFQPVRVADFLIDKDPLFARATLDDDEMAIYEQVYNQLVIDAPKPDLVIYLQASTNTLLRRIKNRGVNSERNIVASYLETIIDAYTSFVHFYDECLLLIVNSNELDWVNSEAFYQQLADYILTIKKGRHYYNPTSTLL